MAVHETVSSSEIRFDLSIFHLFDPSGRYGHFYGVTAWSNRGVAVTGGAFWTFPRVTSIKSTIAAAAIEEIDFS